MKNNIDIVILSDAKTDFHRAVTENAISTIFKSECAETFNIFVVEQQPKVFYKDVNVVNFNEPFNYNKFMNMGARLGNAQYIVFCNNDLNFEDGWATSLVAAIEKRGLNCVSPYSKSSPKHKIISPRGQVYEGVEVGLHLAGWCFMMPREVFEKIGGLDEDFSFWCADNATAEQLIQHGFRIGLVTNSFVEHIGGGENTLKTINDNERAPMTWDLVKKFNGKYNKNLFGVGKL